MIRITMFSEAEKIGGQGVASAYQELVKGLRKNYSGILDIQINSFETADISHYHTVNPKFYLSTFSKKRGVKVGYVHFLPETMAGSISLIKPFQKLFNWYLVAFYKRMDTLVVVNPDFIPKLQALGISEKKITYIPNFVSTDTFYEEPKAAKEAFKKEQGISENKFIILGVGQIQKRKGFDDFIKLVQANPDIQFIWVGGFSFGQITDGYQEYKEIYDHPPENLKLTGIIDRKDMNRYYNIADIFLLPSYSELFPMSILEAFSCGTPVLLRDLELYASILKDYYIKASDVNAMDKLVKEYAKAPEKLLTYQKKSHEAANYYSEENVMSLWKNYYLSLLPVRLTKHAS